MMLKSYETVIFYYSRRQHTDINKNKQMIKAIQ